MISTNSPKTYAATYDRLLKEKPTFLRLRQEVAQQARKWNVELGDIIAHIGEDTGYFSIGMAALHPQACVVHISDDTEMNDFAEEKRLRCRLSNHRILEVDPNRMEVEKESLKAVVSIHLLNAFPNPAELIEKVEAWLKPRGYFLFTTPHIALIKNQPKMNTLAVQLCTILNSTKLELVSRKQIGLCSGDMFLMRKDRKYDSFTP